MSRLSLTFACGPYDRMHALYDGSVQVEGVDLRCLPIGQPMEVFSRMLKNEDFDVAEMSLTHCFTLRASGKARFVTLPVFPSRMFRHGFIFINAKAGIRSPKDLEGKRIGVQGYQMTAAVWIRGMLHAEYGVSFDKVRWLEGGVNERGVPGGATTSMRPGGKRLDIGPIAPDRTLGEMLATGEIDALIGAVRPDTLDTSPDVARLFPDYHPLEVEYFRRTGIFPAMHALVIREELYRQHRWLGTSLYKAVPLVAGKAGASLANFTRLIEDLKSETQGLPLSEVVDATLARSGLVDHYKSERDGADRVENLAELVNAAAAFAQEEEIDNDLAGFLSHASLESGENQAAEGSDALQLMTVHSAKGLEFHVVFITGLEEGLFPHEQSVMEDDGLEEERRLMYVAITRARTRLYLLHAQTRMLHGQTRYNVPSRFIDEIPEALVKRLTPKAASMGSRDAYVPAPAIDRASKKADPGHGFRIGQQVVHAKFGNGVIVDAEGSGTEARLQVNFGRQGMKWLAIQYANLQPA